ncbi:MAG: dynamin family protein [Lachnospiraceae bacterium]|nr:dynamin family protein [Lachnospiraceae bacterium]
MQRNAAGGKKGISKDALSEKYRQMIDFCHDHQLYEYENKLKNKLQDLLSPLKVMIVGEGKSGKSTLLNALVGVDVAAVDDEPKTWCINLYTKTENEEYAELVYDFTLRDPLRHDDDAHRIEKVSVKEATELSERISRADMEDLTEEDKSLSEIRWYLKLPWPEEDIFIVDTPGFNQDRKDTDVEEVSINIGQGVRFVANDGFDKYYYKADLVLWCFCADSVNDSEVEEHLKGVSGQAKKIYGIITKLDRYDEDERESLFQANVDRYRKDNIRECLRSMLPTIYDDDEQEEIEFKERVHEETIRGIRACIEYLLKDNGADAIKIEDSQRYLENIRDQIREIMGSLLEFYFDNYTICKKTLKRIPDEIDPFEKKLEQEIRNLYLTDDSQFSLPAYYEAVWKNSGSDADVYAAMIKRDIESCALLTKGKDVYDRVAEESYDAVDTFYGSIKWKTVTISLFGNETPDEEYDYTPAKFVPDRSVVDVNIQVEQMGLIYQIMQMFQKNTLTHQLIEAFAADYLFQKALEAGRGCAKNALSETHEQYRRSALAYFSAMRSSLQESVLKAFIQLTGTSFDDLPDRIFRLEKELSLIQALNTRDIVYYPTDHSDMLFFEPSVYRRKMKMEPKAPKLFKSLFISYFQTLFDHRKYEVEEAIDAALKKYNGTKKIQAPDFMNLYSSMNDDRDVWLSFPEKDKIEWFGEKEQAEEAYAEVLADYRKECKGAWNAGKLQAEKDVLDRCLISYEEEYLKGIKTFLKEWEAQVQTDTAWCMQNNVLTQLPKTMDHLFYYKQIYAYQHRDDALLKYVIDFSSSHQFPEEWVKNWDIVSVDGKRLSNGIRRIATRILEDLEREILRKREDMGERIWDPCLDKIYLSGCVVCDQYLYVLDQLMRETMLPLWEKYKQSKDNRISNILEFSIKSGKLPDRLQQFLKGEIPELAQYRNVLCGNGKKMSDKWMKYIKKELAVCIGAY